MTPFLLSLVLLSQLFLVAGQLLLKRGMSLMEAVPRPTGRIAALVGGGIALMTGWFLLWTGLLQKLDLSLLYPFQGLTPVLMALASALFLRERLTWSLGLGVSLITAGTLLVGLSS